MNSFLQERPNALPMTLPAVQWILTGLLAVLLLARSSNTNAQEIDFSHDIVPILSSSCIECHGGATAKGGFSMNTRELLVESGYVDLQSPEDSYLLELVQSKDDALQMPPPEKPRLTVGQIELLRRWISQGLPWEAGFSFAPVSYEPPLRPRRVELPPVRDGRLHPIDRLVDAYFVARELSRPARAEDEVFARRVWLDLTGLLPEPVELQAFVQDPAVNKRQRLVRRLLDDELAYAEHWLSFFNDLLRNDYSGTGFITGGRQQISAWLYDALLDNKPFDQFARELIAPPTAASRGFIDGIRWRGEVSAGQTLEIQFAQSVSQAFLGINLKCASCHDSFIDRWTLEDAYGLAAVYAAGELELHRCDQPLGRFAEPAWLFPELGSISADLPREQRLARLAELMTHSDNGRFTRTIANRLWYRLMGRGIVHPLDAMQTEPWDADLLDYLAMYLADQEYDLKAVLEHIATSEIYQAETLPVDRQEASFVFHGPRARRMTAEQFLDAVWQINDTSPAQLDAPIVRGLADDNVSSDVASALTASWIWAASEALPVADEVVTFKKEFSLTGPVATAGCIITCDNEYSLFVNGRHVASDEDWTELQRLALHSHLQAGKNSLVVIGKNGGQEPNPAGLFFQMLVRLEDGHEETIASDTSWEVAKGAPASREGRLGKLPGGWMSAVAVDTPAVWRESIARQGPQQWAAISTDSMPRVRASLMNNSALMRSLGRPMREQIVSMRPDALTTLEALDLANEADLAAAFSEGARHLLASEWNDRRDLIRHIYLAALSRPPSPDEMKVVLQALDDPPTEEEIADLLWAICMLPDFMLVR